MADKERVTLADLQIDDYVEGKGGQVWKVIRSTVRDDGRYVGLHRPGQKPVIQKADQRPITRLVYAKPTPPTLQEAVDTVREVLGGKVLAEQVGVTWFHPPHRALEANPDLLRAHMIRFHGLIPADDEQFIDLPASHRAQHAAGNAGHDHNEGDA